ncbi:MAG: hypothetical protein IKK39_05875 [Thermoguttaceae bacterium]|nr:hypothetical protein [Thermoguttaceae bacterium]MBR4103577.1 hypothetical protein [Thermoguttaceae bacterium]
MSRQKRLNAVATITVVAAFPAFPLFADEPSKPQVEAPQAETTADFVAKEAGDPLDGFDVSLLDLPENASVEATRARLRAIQLEQIRRQTEFNARALKVADEAGNRDAVYSYLSQGSIRPSTPLDPNPNSVAGKIYAFHVATFRRLADAPELPLEVRGEYYRRYLDLAPFASPEAVVSVENMQAFFNALLAEEEAKPSPDLGRVITLRERVQNAIVYIPPQNIRRSKFDRADAEKLLDVPQGESAEFYDAYSLQLYAAYQSAPKDASFDALRSRLVEAKNETLRLRREARKQEAETFDRDAVQRLLDVPYGETTAFYLERFQKLNEIFQEIAPNPELFPTTQKVEAAIAYVAKRLAYADDLSPLERFDYFRRWVPSLDLNGLLDALDAETARDATSEIDRQRRPYLELALLQKRATLVFFEDADVKTKRGLGLGNDATQGPTDVFGNPQIDSERATRVLALADQYVARALDGATPWRLGGSWAQEAAQFAYGVEQRFDDPKLAAYIGKAIAARLAESDAESDRQIGLSLSRKILNEELRARFEGRFIPVEGQNLDGTPFDWSVYRGAPTLIEIVKVSPLGTPIVRNRLAPTTIKAGERGVDTPSLPAKQGAAASVANAGAPFLAELGAQLDEYEKAGLRRVRYVAAPLETARLFVEQVQNAASADAVAKTDYILKSYADNAPIFAAPSDAEFVTPTSWRNHWTDALYQQPQAILVDADGKTLANDVDAQKFGEALRKLFPNVAAKAK